jgi:hypothetical protein
MLPARAQVRLSYIKLLIEKLEGQHGEYTFGMALRDLIANSVLQREANSLHCIQFLDEVVSAQRFLSGRLNMYQLNMYHPLLMKGLCEDGLPLTRDAWYRN